MLNNESQTTFWRMLEQIQQKWSPRPGEFSRSIDVIGLGRRGGAHLSDGLHEQWRRVERVKQAMNLSGSIAFQLICAKLPGIDLTSIWSVLLNACKEVALYYGCSILGGAIVGGAIGSLAAGVGAAPGAVGGAVAGAQVGGWILAWLGLKSLVEYLGEALPQAISHYENGFRLSWGGSAPNTRMPYEQGSTFAINVDAAASQFAAGHVIVIMAMLSALVSYLTRGRGDKAKILQEVRQSPRLGANVADWIAKNEAKLLNHPSLQHRPKQDRPTATAGGNNSTSNTHRTNGPEKKNRQPEDIVEGPKRMAQKKVPCFATNDLPSSKVPEFDRQLAGQERGLNNMTVDEYIKGREAFDKRLATRNPAIAKQARRELEDKLQIEAQQDLMSTGMLPEEAEEKASKIAREKMGTLAALHNPDMVAGGKDLIDDFGDRKVNSRIGSQWRNRIAELDAAAAGVPKDSRGQLKMNAKLERCK
jgi:Novel toxin 15